MKIIQKRNIKDKKINSRPEKAVMKFQILGREMGLFKKGKKFRKNHKPTYGIGDELRETYKPTYRTAKDLKKRKK